MRASANTTNYPEIHTDRAFYYVSAIDGDRRWLVAGPYPTHQQALDMVRPVQDLAREQEPRSFFYAWGTAGSDDSRKTPLGAWSGEANG